jgi:hypothetical protein
MFGGICAADSASASSASSTDLVKSLLPAEVQGPAPAATALHPMLYLFALLGAGQFETRTT